MARTTTNKPPNQTIQSKQQAPMQPTQPTQPTQLDNVPAAMRCVPSWMFHDNKKPLALAPSTNGSMKFAPGNKEEHAYSFEVVSDIVQQCWEYGNTNPDFKYKSVGLGFRTTPDNDIVCIDIDVDPPPFPLTDLTSKTYVERSPSKRGYHAFFKGPAPTELRRQKHHGGVVEIFYKRNHYVTVTGDRLPEAQTELGELTPELWETLTGAVPAADTTDTTSHSPNCVTNTGPGESDNLSAGNPDGQEYVPETKDANDLRGSIRNAELSSSLNQSQQQTTSPFKDKDFLKHLKGTRFEERLYRMMYEGDWADFFGTDRSGADFFCMCQLLEMNNMDQEQACRLMRKSEMYRPKYEKKHHGPENPAYLEMTAQKAVAAIIQKRNTMAALREINIIRDEDDVSDDDLPQIIQRMSDYDFAMGFSATHAKDLAFDGGKQPYKYVGTHWVPIPLADFLTPLADFLKQFEHMLKPRAYARLLGSGVMFGILKMVPGVHKTTLNLDQSVWKLNFLNGTYDLQEHVFYTHRYDDFLTSVLDYEYDPNAYCAAWEGFLDHISNDYPDTRDYLQEMCGSFIGGGSVKQVFFLYGDTNTGKSTFVNTVRNVLDSYSTVAQVSVLSGNARTDRPNSELYAAIGKRLLIVNEAERGYKLHEGFFKLLTGNDRIRTRPLHGNGQEFTPTFKILLHGNSLPTVMTADSSMWNRLAIVPFNNKIKNMDPHVQTLFDSERSGIMNWMIEGFKLWQTTKYLPLQPTDDMVQRIKGVQEDLNYVRQFLNEECEKSDTAFVGHADMYRAYRNWCKDHYFADGEISSTAFINEMGNLEHKQQKRTISSGVRVKGYAGIVCNYGKVVVHMIGRE